MLNAGNKIFFHSSVVNKNQAIFAYWSVRPIAKISNHVLSARQPCFWCILN